MKSNKKIMIYGLIIITIAVTASIVAAISNSSNGNNNQLGIIDVSTEKDEYEFGEGVNISTIFSNNGYDEITLTSLSYNLLIVGPSGNVFSMSVMTSLIGSQVVSANSEVEICSYSWDQTDTEHNQVPPGEYTITVELIDGDYKGETNIIISS